MSFGRSVLANRHAVWAVAIASAIFGVLAYLEMPMQLSPDTAPPVVNVITAYPGASAADVTDALSRPMEEELASLEGIVAVRSSSQDNLSLVSLEFGYERDVELAAVDVQNAITRIRGALPPGIREPRVLRQSTSDRPIVTFGLVTEPMVSARRLAEDVVGPRLQRISGVAAVDVFGGSAETVLVEFDPEQLEAYLVSPADVIRTLQEHNIAGPAGELDTGGQRHRYRLDARAESLDALGQLPIVSGGTRVLLRDVARLEIGTLDDDARFRIGETQAIAVQVFKTEDANTVEVVEAALAEVASLREEYPTLDIIVGEESASFTRTSIGNLLSNVWQALLLASVIIFLFIGHLRASLVAVVSMPLSYGLTFVGMRLAGVQFDLVTLSAVILAVGMVVDASVVVLENVLRLMKEGRAPEEAASEGVDEILTPVIAGAATTVTVLVPLLFLEGFIGKTFGPLAMTLLIAFTSSVIVALVLVPVLSMQTAGSGALDRLGERIAWPFTRLMEGLRRAYVALLRRALRFRWLTLVLAFASVAAGAVMLRGQGMEVIPRMDGGSFFISLETPSGTSLDETERAIEAIAGILSDEAEVETVQAQVGYEAGMRYFASGSVQGPTQGFITVTLSPRTDRVETLWDIQARVRQRIRSEVPAIRSFTVRELGNTANATTTAPIVVRVTGDDVLVLDRLGEEILGRLAAVDSIVEPARTWRLDQRRFSVHVDALRAGQLGLSPAAIATQMQMGSVGVHAGDFHALGEDPIPILARFQRGEDPAPEALLDYPVILRAAETTIPLRSIAALEETTSAGLMTRDGLAPTLDITAVLGDRPLSEAVVEVEDALRELIVPDGYAVELTGERDDLSEATGEIAGALIISVIAVYLLLAGQLRSFVHPITIMLTVPLAIVGVALGLVAAGKPVSMPVMVGLVLLVGIVVNSSIILLEYVRRARADGRERRDALIDSVGVRFRPIMMTALSTIVGMIPLAGEWALGAERFSPLAIAVIGGLSAATLLTLIVMPVLYDIIDDLSVAVVRLLRRSPPNTRAGVVAMALVAALPGSARSQDVVTIDVDQSVALALEHSPGLRAASAEVAAAEAVVGVAQSRFYPRVDVVGRYSRLSEAKPGSLALPNMDGTPGASGTSFGESITNSYLLRGQVVQPLFTGLSLLRAREVSRGGADLADARRAEAEADVRAAVVEAYFRLFQARALVDVSQQSIALIERHRERLVELLEHGRATTLDVARVETRLSFARIQLLGEEDAERNARLSLLSLLGLPADADVVLSEQPSPEVTPALRQEDAALDAAVRSRPELETMRGAVQVAQSSVGLARASYWPQLNLVAGYTMAQPNERYVPPVNEFNDSWDISVNLGWTAWAGGARRHQTEEAAQRAAAAEARLAQLEERTALEVRQGLAALETAGAHIEAAANAVAVAESALDEAQTLFAAGRVDSSEILERTLELAQARALHIGAQVAWRLGLNRLERIAGGSLVD